MRERLIKRTIVEEYEPSEGGELGDTDPGAEHEEGPEELDEDDHAVDDGEEPPPASVKPPVRRNEG